MKKNIKIITFVLLVLNIFRVYTYENKIEFKPYKIIRFEYVNKNDKYKTAGWAIYYYLIGQMKDGTNVGIKLNNLGKESLDDTKAIIINSKQYDKRFNKYFLLEQKLLKAVFSSWYEVSLLSKKIEKSDYYYTETSPRKELSILKDKFNIEVVLDCSYKDQYLFRPIEPIDFNKLEIEKCKLN